MTDLTLTWKADGCTDRELDWSWGGYVNVFTLAGGDDKAIVRWKPSVRDTLFDDDHVVWIPYSTKHIKLIDRNIFIYTRVKRTLNYFKDINPHDWCDLNN